MYGRGQEEEEGCKQFTETWLVLEFCDRGNLQDAVDRGVFAAKRSDPDSDEPPPRNVPAVVYAPCPKPGRAMSRPSGAVLRDTLTNEPGLRHIRA